jgi:hypothetical protein
MTGILIRWLCAFLLLTATFNPTPWNYARWVETNGSDQIPLAVLGGLILLIGYVVYMRATLRSIGGFGMILVGAFVSAIIWVLVDWGVLNLDNPAITVWLGLVALSFTLGIGLSWSIIRRKLSGQADVDDVED